MFGKVFAELLTGKEEAKLPVPITPLSPVKGRLLKQNLMHLAFTVNQLSNRYNLVLNIKRRNQAILNYKARYSSDELYRNGEKSSFKDIGTR